MTKQSEEWEAATKLYAAVAMGRSVRNDDWIQTVRNTPSAVLMALLVLLGSETAFAKTTGARAAVQAVLADRNTRSIQKSGRALAGVGLLASFVFGVAEIIMPLWSNR